MYPSKCPPETDLTREARRLRNRAGAHTNGGVVEPVHRQIVYLGPKRPNIREDGNGFGGRVDVAAITSASARLLHDSHSSQRRNRRRELVASTSK